MEIFGANLLESDQVGTDLTDVFLKKVAILPLFGKMMSVGQCNDNSNRNNNYV